MDPSPASLWHVTVTVAGEPVGTSEIRAALGRFEAEHPFLVCARYARERAEIQYWEEAEQVTEALALASALWAEHRRTARLPDWRVCGVEVVDRATYLRRVGESSATSLHPVGIVPF